MILLVENKRKCILEKNISSLHQPLVKPEAFQEKTEDKVLTFNNKYMMTKQINSETSFYAAGSVKCCSSSVFVLFNDVPFTFTQLWYILWQLCNFFHSSVIKPPTSSPCFSHIQHLHDQDLFFFLITEQRNEQIT